MPKKTLISRRQWLGLTPAMAAPAFAAFPFLHLGATPSAGDRDLFRLGVASGYPTSESVVLWTRLAPEPLAPQGGMSDADVEVLWELAEDEAFSKTIRQGHATAVADEAHSLHVEVDGLSPARDYWYRFTARGARSEVGRTRTAPAANDGRTVRLAFGSCQQYEQGYFSAYRDMARQPLDLVVHLGDYIYESSWGQTHVRYHEGGVPVDLPEFRARYALYKMDPNLRAAHAAFPWMAIWDDHEVANDYTNDISPMMSDPQQFLAVRAAAYRAWWEHMPVPRRMRPTGATAQIHGKWRFGSLVDLLLLDARQNRDHHVCLYSRNTAPPVDCEERLDPSRSMLGKAQQDWFERALAQPATQWTVLAQPTLMASVDRSREGEEPAYWMDGWDGYPATRDFLLDALTKHRPGSGVVLSGDIHSFWAADISRRQGEAPVATEFVGGAISSEGPSVATVERLLARNPDLHYGRGDKRGYGLATFHRDRAEVVFRAVQDPHAEDSKTDTLARFAVAAGKPGVLKA